MFNFTRFSVKCISKLVCLNHNPNKILELYFADMFSKPCLNIYCFCASLSVFLCHLLKNGFFCLLRFPYSEFGRLHPQGINFYVLLSLIFPVNSQINLNQMQVQFSRHEYFTVGTQCLVACSTFSDNIDQWVLASSGCSIPVSFPLNFLSNGFCFF